MIAHGPSLRDPSLEERKASASDGTAHPPQRGTARRICEPSPFRSARAAPCCEAGRTRTLPRSRGGSSPLARPPAAGDGDGFVVQWVSHFRSDILPNADRDPSRGIGGYHGLANVPYCFVNAMGSGFTVADPQSLFALALSHEIAEMVVDPQANLENPEVCDPCGPNCQTPWIDYFTSGGGYLR